MIISWLYGMSPVNVLKMALDGIIDVTAILGYVALIFMLVMFIVAIRKRGRSTIINLAALVALVALITVPLGSGSYIDCSPEMIITPSAGFLQRWNDASSIELAAMITNSPDTLDDYVDAFLARATASGRPYYQGLQVDITKEDDECGLLLASDSTEHILPVGQCFISNPLEEGENRRMFNLEAELLQASANLERTTALHIYRLSGPRNPERPDVLYSAMKQLTNVNVQPLDLSKDVPLLAALVVIDNPQRDLSEDEALRLGAYLARGGRLLLLTDYAYAGLPYLGAVMRAQGIAPLDGVVFDPMSQMGGRSEYPIPSLTDHVVARTLSAAGRSVLMPLSHALIEEPQAGARVYSLLNTSDSAYMQLNAYQHASLEQGAQDPTGPFSLAMAAVSGLTRVCWIASTDMASVEADADVGGANQAFLRACMNYLVDELVEPLPAKPVR